MSPAQAIMCGGKIFKLQCDFKMSVMALVIPGVETEALDNTLRCSTGHCKPTGAERYIRVSQLLCLCSLWLWLHDLMTAPQAAVV